MHVALSQNIATYTFEYSGIPPCYLEDNDIWKTSHGSPCYVTYQTSGWYNNLLLATTNSNSTQKSEGAFTSFKFSKNNNYRIEIQLRSMKGSPNIEVYAANNLTDKKDLSCKTAVPPTVSNKKLIGEASASGTVSPPLYYRTVSFPSANSYWNPDKDYDYIWIASSLSSEDSSSFIIGKIVIYDNGIVSTDPPTMPGNLRATVKGREVTLKWDPSTGVNPIMGYRINFNGWIDTTKKTEYTRKLNLCLYLKIQVRAFDLYGNLSPIALTYAQTSVGENIVEIDTLVNLSKEKDNRFILQSDSIVILQSGFSVKANNAKDFFKARIGCESLSIGKGNEELYLIDEDDIVEASLSALTSDASNDALIYSIDEDDSFETTLNVLSPHAGNDIVIYPNPTSEIITIEYHQFTGIEKVLLFDITGKPLLDCKLSGITSNIDVSSFLSGIYFIKVITQNSVFVKKFIKK